MVKMLKPWAPLFLALATVGPLHAEEGAGEFSGYVSGELRLFSHDGQYPGQEDDNLSLAIQPEYYRNWDDGRQSFTVTPFLRLDQSDPERTHADLRELTWLMAADAWELRLGLRKDFWGVTESRHLVDVINQTDLVESPDGEEKLGQPMANLALIGDWGTFDFYWLPWFRERTFSGKHGRLRGSGYVDRGRTRYASSKGERHQDFAVRWSLAWESFDWGISHFSGTGRTPTLIAGTDESGDATWAPLYQTVDQTGLDLQSTQGAWLWKFETVSVTGEGDGDRYAAAVGGFEYTLVGVFDSAADLGLIAEYLFDDRDEAAPHALEDDIMAGVRLTLNDAQSTEGLVGMIVDRESGALSFSLEASRRLGEAWKLTVEGRALADVPADDPNYGLRKDAYLQVDLAWYF